MKKIHLIVITLVVALIAVFLILGDSVEENGDLDSEEVENGVVEDGEGLLDMQGYFLNVPQGYECEGGFTDGYRYLDAECEPLSDNGYRIEVDRGLVSASLDENDFVDSRIMIRSRDLNAECRAYGGDPIIQLNAEHYICEYFEGDERVVTISVGKTFDGWARWFEAHIKRDAATDYELGEDTETLVDFLNQAIMIDWSDYDGS